MQSFIWTICSFLLCTVPIAADESGTDHSLQLTLPPDIYAVPGVEFSIFHDNIVLSESSDRFRFEVSCDIGRTEDRRWTVTPGSADVGVHRISVSVYGEDGTQLATDSARLHVAPDSAGAGTHRPLNILIIGDSLTHASVYPNEIARLLSQPGNPDFRMLGTHQPTAVAEGVAHEGYGGWTWERFVTKYEPDPDGTYRKRSSPFVFLNDDGKPALDLPRYFHESCHGRLPDYVVIMLGINDCFSAPADSVAGTDARIDSMFGHADRLLAALREAAPETQIGLCLTTPPNARQAAFEANYKDRYSRWGWKRIQHRLVQRQIEFVAQKDDPRISLIPTQLNLDPVNGYPDNNGVHPNVVGYRQIGATIFGWLKHRMQASVRPALPAAPDSEHVFLLPYFLGNGETGIYFAYSHDGYKFLWLKDGEVVMPAPSWGDESLTRDPSIIFRDGTFHMVWTTSWNSRSIGYASSKDLKTWTPASKIDLWGERTDVKNTWAPELHYDPEKQEYLVLFSTTTLQELNDKDGSVDPHGHDHRTYAVRTRDFQTWTEPLLFFSPQNPEYGVIDPFIAFDDRHTASTVDDRWVMVIKNEMAEEQGGKNLRLTFSSHMQGPYDTTLSAPIAGAGTQIVNQMAEGPSLFRRAGRWFLYWDAPGSDYSYCLATSPDLKTWTNQSDHLSLPAKQMRHGTVLMVPRPAVVAALSVNASP
ncbi:MAG: family 43 glycosylhydrolase [Fuerstiella sp.]